MTALTGTLRLARLQVRTGWKGLLLGPVLLAGLVLAIAHSIVGLYPTAEARAAYAASNAIAPASAAFNGRWPDLDTLGGITTNEVGFLALLLFPTVASLLAVRHTRREEDAGRTDLVTAGCVGRLAPLAAGSLVVAVAMVLVGLLAFAGQVWVGLPSAGSGWYAASLALFALSFAATGLLAAEVSRDARTATGLSLAAVFGMFVLRAALDAGNRSLWWVTPSGWLPRVGPFGDPQVWPLVAYLVVSGFALGAAAWVAVHRDLYGGLVAARLGPATARAALATPFGLAWRLTRGAAVGWAAGVVAWGVSMGALSTEMTALLRANPQLLEALGIDRPEDVLTAMSATLAAVGAAALVVQGVLRLAAEEDSGRLGLVASGPTRRRAFWLAWGLVLAVEVLVVLVVQALAFGLTTWRVSGVLENLTASLQAALALGPAVMLVGAIGLAVRAAVPRLAAVAWLLVGWMAVVGFVGDALDLPTWARRLSPAYAVGRVPVDDPNVGVLGGFVGAALVLVVVSAGAFSRRDLRAG